jgi:hypothetical protein
LRLAARFGIERKYGLGRIVVPKPFWAAWKPFQKKGKPKMDRQRRLEAIEKQAGRISGTPGIEVDFIEEAWAGSYEPAVLKMIIKISKRKGTNELFDELKAAFDHHQLEGKNYEPGTIS